MPIPLRADFSSDQVRAAARRSKNGPQARRLLALASIYDGGMRSEAARIGGVTLQIVRDWVLKFNAAGPAGLIDRKPHPDEPKSWRSRISLSPAAALGLGRSRSEVSGRSVFVFDAELALEHSSGPRRTRPEKTARQD